MKKQIVYLFSISTLFLSACSSKETKTEADKVSTEESTTTESTASNLPKKYEIKSGIITFESTMEVAGMVIKGKDIVYFDDYGNLECKETYKDGKLTESFFSDGKDLYKVIHDAKTAYNSGKAYQGTEMPCEWAKFDPKEKENGNAKKLANETIAGKDCEIFTQNVKSYGTNTKFAGWKHICLMTETSSKDSKTLTKAVKIEENVSVSPDKFKVPAGYKTEKI